MKAIAIFLCLMSCLAVRVSAQQTMRMVPDEPVVCYHNFENRKEFIAPRQDIRLARSTRSKTASFQVEYVDFPDDQRIKEAFEYALSIWEYELISSVPIRIRAEWRSLRAGVLGEAIWGSAYANFGGEPEMNTFYPVALAEKLAGRELNAPEEPDIIASFNGNASWYFGVDGNTPAGRMDFVTIVLHEIAHGLGFTHSYRVTGSSGTVGLSTGSGSAPLAFDLYVADRNKKNLFQDFHAPSSAMANALQSGALYFQVSDNHRPRLYAPSTFSGGSSISHLDEATYNDQGDANRLMTPHISLAEAIHDPGDVVRDIFAALGWVTTRILHTPLRDTERLDGTPYNVIAEVVGDEGYSGGAVELHYTIDGTNFTTVGMTPAGPPNRFQANIPGTTEPRTYGYYLSADNNGQRVTSPGRLQTQGSSPEQGLHYFMAGPDTDPPVINHTPVSYIFADAPNVALEAEVTDNQGVATVNVSYTLNGGPSHVVAMSPVADNLYRVMLSFPGVSIGDQIEYRITAHDLSYAQNAVESPSEGSHRIAVVGIHPTRDSYTNNFNTPSDDFFGTSFSIATPGSFGDGAIHSDHPYKNGSGPNDESHYIYQLQIPIRLRETNALMRFDEIVLVEPGDNGSVFGDDGFYDYVVVEGSADGGATWLPFIPGYDARANNTWLSRYNGNIIDHVSQAVGEPSLYRERTIDLLENGNFSPGDEVLIRFRLFADQLANGWGWAIDNLVIQEEDEPVTGVPFDPVRALHVYPVPAYDFVSLEFSGLNAAEALIDIVDARGANVLSQNINPTDALTLDIRHLPPGVYFVRALVGGSLLTRKFVKTGH